MMAYAAGTDDIESAEQTLEFLPRLADAGLTHRTPAADSQYDGLFWTTVGAREMGGFVEGGAFTHVWNSPIKKSLSRCDKLLREPRYVTAAWEAGLSLGRNQRPEGNWYFRLRPETGEVAAEYASNAIDPVLFFDALPENPIELAEGQATRRNLGRIAAARKKRLSWIMDNPVKTFRWEGCYEDIPERPPYAELRWWDASYTLQNILSHKHDLGNGYLARRKGFTS